MNDTEIMRQLISYTFERSIENKTFTGSFIVKKDQIIQKSITSIEPDKNPLAHAELNAMNAAIPKFGPILKGCQLYTTQEPCPMCASAIVWTGIEKVVFGIQQNDTQWADSNSSKSFFENSNILCVGPFLEDECQTIDQHLIDNGI